MSVCPVSEAGVICLAREEDWIADVLDTYRAVRVVT